MGVALVLPLKATSPYLRRQTFGFSSVHLFPLFDKLLGSEFLTIYFWIRRLPLLGVSDYLFIPPMAGADV